MDNSLEQEQILAAQNYHFIVPEASGGMRLDKFLSQPDLFPAEYALSRTKIQSLIEREKVSCGGVMVKNPATLLKINQEIMVHVSKPTLDIPVATPMVLDIIHEDADVIVLNKPANLTVHPAAGHYDDTLVNGLVYHYQQNLSGVNGTCRPGIVHRLDKDTSGVMVVAKTDFAHQELAVQFSDHSITREYHGIVYGSPKTQTGIITGNIGRHPHDRQKMALLKIGGKPATTHYKVLKQFIHEGLIIASLVSFRLETGRTHQIRVHCAASGFAIVGDPLYLPKHRPLWRKLPQNMQDFLNNYPYQALHARLLGFIHPTTKEYHEYPSEYSDLFKKILDLICF